MLFAPCYALSTMLQSWGGFYTEQSMILLAFSAAALAPIAVKFDFSLGGFLAVVSAFYCGVSVPCPATW